MLSVGKLSYDDALDDAPHRLAEVADDPHEPEARETTSACLPLSGREKEVLALVAAGQSNKSIALRLALSPHTVKRHVTNLFNKLDLARRSQATAWYYLNPETSGCCQRPH